MHDRLTRLDIDLGSRFRLVDCTSEGLIEYIWRLWGWSIGAKHGTCCSSSATLKNYDRIKSGHCMVGLVRNYMAASALVNLSWDEGCHGGCAATNLDLLKSPGVSIEM